MIVKEKVKKVQNRSQLHAEEASKYAEESSRLETFQNAWPHASPSAKVMANAGFIFRPKPGKPDNVKCPNCRINVNEWLPEDDPKVFVFLK